MSYVSNTEHQQFNYVYSNLTSGSASLYVTNYASRDLVLTDTYMATCGTFGTYSWLTSYFLTNFTVAASFGYDASGQVSYLVGISYNSAQNAAYVTGYASAAYTGLDPINSGIGSIIGMRWFL